MAQGRWKSSSEPVTRIIATIIAPTPLLAATFVIFGEIIRRIGQIYSRLSPRNCPCFLDSPIELRADRCSSCRYDPFLHIRKYQAHPARTSRSIDTDSWGLQDVISLVVQGLGGGLAATADPLTNGRDPETVRITCLVPLARLPLTRLFTNSGRSCYARRYCIPARFVVFRHSNLKNVA
jgi:hypothetical protein